MSRYAHVNCPYCGAEMVISVSDYKGIRMAHCSEEEGGCGMKFVVRTEIAFIDTAIKEEDI